MSDPVYVLEELGEQMGVGIIEAIITGVNGDMISWRGGGKEGTSPARDVYATMPEAADEAKRRCKEY